MIEENPWMNRDSLMWTLNGKLEWICEHGEHHTIVVCVANHSLSHECDGCCENVVTLDRNQVKSIGHRVANITRAVDIE